MTRFEVPTRRRRWPFALAILAMAFTAWWLFGRERDAVRASAAGEIEADSAIPAARYRPGTVERTPEVEAFLSFASAGDTSPADGSAGAYTARGLQALAAALQSMGTVAHAGDAVLEARLDSLRAHAGRIGEDAGSSRGARAARDAFGIAGDVLVAMQRRRFPAAADEVMHMRRAAWGVVDSRPLSGQEPAVRGFFERVADALQAMTTGRVAA